MNYEVKFPGKSVEKKFYHELEKLSHDFQDAIIKEITKLATNPRPYGTPKIKPPVEVYSYVAHHRIRIGGLRVIYDVNDKLKVVWILALRRRNERTY